MIFMPVQNPIYHCYFLLGMLFEKMRHHSLLLQMSSVVYLSQAYFLLQKIHESPALHTVWYFLLEKPVKSKKEEKRIERLFRLVHILKHPPEHTYDILHFFAQWFSEDKQGIFIILKEKKEINDISSLEELATVLMNFHEYVELDSSLEEFIKAAFATIMIQKMQILSLPIVRLTFKEHPDFWCCLDVSMRNAVDTLDLLSLLKNDVDKKIAAFGRNSHAVGKVMTIFYRKPVVQSKHIQSILNVAKPNALLFIEKALQAGIFQRVTSKQRNNIYSNAGIMHIFFNFS